MTASIDFLIDESESNPSGCKLVNIKNTNVKYDIYIGRGTEWGNPYSHLSLDRTIAKFKVETREDAVRLYKEYLLSSPELLKKLELLERKTLGCYCWPLLCHGMVLIEVLNDIIRKRPQTRST